jgi:hypothetical protein
MQKELRLPIYSSELAPTSKFIEFWANRWSPRDHEQDERLYRLYIDPPLTSESLPKVFLSGKIKLHFQRKSVER